jgi:hypothetical protein
MAAQEVLQPLLVVLRPPEMEESTDYLAFMSAWKLKQLLVTS